MSPFELTLDTPPLPPPGGAVRRRLAVRAVIVRDGLFLLIRSKVNGDWKFPGGGVEPGETPEKALVREILEETGYRSTGRFSSVGKVWERAPGREIPGSLFVAESRYFSAEVTGPRGPLRLDDYEKALGFLPEWVTVDRALEDNRKLLGSPSTCQPPWLPRETRVLELLTGNEGRLYRNSESS